MADVDLAAMAAAASMLAEEPDDQAIRKWFEKLPPDTQARLIPMNPKIAEALMRTGNGHSVHGDMEFEMPVPAEPHPADGHHYDGWAYDSGCVQCRRPEHEHFPFRHKFRPRSPILMLLGLSITLVGLLVQFPGTCIVVVGRRLMSWAEGQEEDDAGHTD